MLDELDKQQGMRAVDAALKRHETVSAEVHAGVCLSHSNYIYALTFVLLFRRLGYRQ